MATYHPATKPGDFHPMKFTCPKCHWSGNLTCERCGVELLDVVAMTVRLGGPRVCGPCIDKQNGVQPDHVRE